jgi:hypothetical protein
LDDIKLLSEALKENKILITLYLGWYNTSNATYELNNKYKYMKGQKKILLE